MCVRNFHWSMIVTTVLAYLNMKTSALNSNMTSDFKPDVEISKKMLKLHVHGKKLAKMGGNQHHTAKGFES